MLAVRTARRRAGALAPVGQDPPQRALAFPWAVAIMEGGF